MCAGLFEESDVGKGEELRVGYLIGGWRFRRHTIFRFSDVTATHCHNCLFIGSRRKHKHNIGSLSRKVNRTCKTTATSHSPTKAILETQQFLGVPEGSARVASIDRDRGVVGYIYV